MVDLAEKLAGLSPEERRLLELTLREKGIEIPRLQIPRRAEERPYYPLSYSQQRQWFIHQLDPFSSAYHVSSPMRARGRLDLGALEAAFRGLVERHETLRTTFAVVGGDPVQVVAESAEVALPLIDLRRLEARHRDRESVRAASAHLQEPFDLERGPLLRPGLIRLEDDLHALLLVMHHIVSDGWSLGVLFRELLALYEAARAGRPSPLEPLRVQYADYALWQREPAQVKALEEHLEYWKERLAGSPQTLELPTDRPYPEVQTHRGHVVDLVLDAGVIRPLRELCRGEKTTLFVGLLAVFQALLARFTGQRDVSVGSPIAGRNRQEIEGLIGFFVNTLVLRVDLDAMAPGGDPTFRRLLGHLQEVNAGANAHQDLPFDRLVDELQPERNLVRPPLYQVSFAFQAEPGGGLEVPGLELSAQGARNPTIQVELAFTLTETPHGVRGQWVYNADLFDHTKVARLARHFRRLLEGALARSDARLSELEVLSAAERHQLVVEWNAPDMGEPGELFSHRLVEASVDRHPERAVIVYESTDGQGGFAEVSYGELEARANRLAHRLIELGVGPETVVAISMQRSPETVVAALGVHKAGGAYLPLDPELPEERLRFMVDDALRRAPRVLVAGPGAAPCLLEAGLEVVPLGGGDELAGCSSERPAVPLRGENPAYVIYTSGSTGKPKGVVIQHRSLANRLAWSLEHDGHVEPFVYLNKTTISFDVAVLETFLPPVHGGHMVLARPGGQWDLSYLLELIREADVTLTSFPPSMHTVLVERSDLARCRSLQVVYTTGEAVPPELPARFAERLDVALVNRYGPTEATIAVLQHRCDPRAAGSVPVGRPLARAEVYLLDRRLAPVPIGVVGEIHVGGVCLARGYLHRPALTAERFVPHPLADRPGGRLYRTGDLARLRADGTVSFLGRIDHQVKVRGFRIELGEIETALRRSPAVAEAVVVDRRESSGMVQLVAYVVAAEEAGAEPGTDSQALRAELAEHLPEHMVPALVVFLDALPKLASGKIDRRALPEPGVEARPASERVAPRDEVERRIAAIWCEVLGLETVGVDESFFELGGHSLLLVRVQGKLREAFGRELPVIELFRHPTVASLAQALGGGKAEAEDKRRGEERAEKRRRSAARQGHDVAIVAMTCRFPGARDLDAFWRNLEGGVESVRFFSDEELLAAGVPRASLEHPDYVKAMATIDEPDYFDAGLFGMSPREAQLTDPQQRLFLECSWEVLERAGYDPSTYPGAIGVYAGVGATRYWLNLFFNPDLSDAIGTLPVALANEKDFLPTKVSYKLDLKGPSVNVQTACSTSMVAAHLACQALLDGECDMALAGGVSVLELEPTGYLYVEDGVASPDGHCRTFDERARGAVGGHGVGVVVLKRLEDALRDGDHVHAVIRGSAINNDGSHKVGFTAPSVEGQAKVIAEAQALAGVEPGEIGYVEAHGTATPLGDPIEVTALKEVFGTEAAKRTALGSVKTNFGHLNAAAGVAGLVKTALSLEHGQIPPSLHFEKPNPQIDFEASPFYVATELHDFPSNGAPRRAGVSSFGLGGTNVHMVLEEAPPAEASGPSRAHQLLLLSAHTPSALESATERLITHLKDQPLESGPEAGFADAAFTLQVGRRRLGCRRALVVESAADAVAALESRDPKRLLEGRDARQDRGVAFLLPGVGDHYPQMARGLYDAEPTFREMIDHCCEVLEPILGEDLRATLFPEEEAPAAAGKESGGEGEVDFKALLGRRRRSAAERRLDRTRFAQPAVFVVEVALARLLAEWGLEPEALIGYSLGEYAAAHLAGVLELDDALALVAERALLIEGLPEGAMLAVPLSEAETRPLLGEELSLAVTNGPRVSVVSGPVSAIEALEAELAERGVTPQRLAGSHAFHSTMMEPIAERFRARLAEVALQPPRIPFVSNVTGTWITPAEALDPEYWVRHLCGTVRFSEGLESLLGGGSDRLLLEVGPGQALATSARQHPAAGPELEIVAALRDGRERRADVAFLLGALARAWLAGVRVDWAGFARHERRRRLPLPTYPFERQRYWIERKVSPFATAGRYKGRHPDLADWLYVPRWRLEAPLEPARPAEGDEGESERWLVFADAGGLGEKLAARLRAAGREVVVVEAGEAFAEGGGEGGELRYRIDRSSAEDYRRLLAELAAKDAAPSGIAHLWSLDGAGMGEGKAGEREAVFEAAQERGLYSLFRLVRGLVEEMGGRAVTLAMVTAGTRSVSGREALHPEQATVHGALRVIPQEHRDVACRSIDVEPPPPGGFDEAELVEQLAAELAAGCPELAVAFRPSGRHVETYEAVKVPAATAGAPRLRRGGVYLITGGLGRIGLRLAHHLGESYGAKLVLVGRSALPPREEWAAWLESREPWSDTGRKIQLLQALEAAGAEVVTVAADAADREAMARAVATAHERFGALHGVIHLAGTLSTGLRVPVEEVEPEVCRAQFRPKVEALWALEEVLEGQELDFCSLFSSLATVLGGLGFGAYASANAYVDAYAHRHARGSGVPWVAGDWDGWPASPIHLEMAQMAGLEPAPSEGAMSGEEAIAAWERTLVLRGFPQVVISTDALEPRIDDWLRGGGALEAGGEETAEADSGGLKGERPALKTPYVEPETDGQRAIAGIWQRLLGLESVGIHDHYFELGGDSLLATQMLSQVRRDLGARVTFADFFGAPTVAGLAAVVEGAGGEEELSELEALLDSIEELDDDEIDEDLLETAIGTAEGDR